MRRHAASGGDAAAAGRARGAPSHCGVGVAGGRRQAAGGGDAAAGERRRGAAHHRAGWRRTAKLEQHAERRLEQSFD
eukprot:4477629-Prymnesium_polylepis.1